MRMDRRRFKFLMLGLGVLGSMAFLLLVGINQGGVYYFTVSEFLDHPDRGEGGFRVNGNVVPGTIERLPSGMDVRFVMSDGSRTVPVAYHGIVPDTFVDDAAVVVEGRLSQDGTFSAHTLLAKCPSKYEAADDTPPALEASLAGGEGS
jgi:cytochrome c-type biogenesis protein CcmE